MIDTPIIPVLHTWGVGTGHGTWMTHRIQTKKKDEKFKTGLDYIVSLGPIWASTRNVMIGK